MSSVDTSKRDKGIMPYTLLGRILYLHGKEVEITGRWHVEVALPARLGMSGDSSDKQDETIIG